MIRKRYFEIKEKKFEEEKMIAKKVLDLIKKNYNKSISPISNYPKIKKLEHFTNHNSLKESKKNKKMHLIFFLNWIFTKKNYNQMNNSFNKILSIKIRNIKLKKKLSFLNKLIQHLNKKKKKLIFLHFKNNYSRKKKRRIKVVSIFFNKSKRIK